MNVLTLLVVIGFLFGAALVSAICIEVYKNTKRIPFSPGCPPEETARRMVRLVRTGHFRMHVLSNDSPPFDDAASVAEYKKFIGSPAVHNYLKNVKGWSQP